MKTQNNSKNHEQNKSEMKSKTLLLVCHKSIQRSLFSSKDDVIVFVLSALQSKREEDTSIETRMIS